MKNLIENTAIALVALACQNHALHAQADGGIFKLKHTSVFTQTAAHNPFWPIGWVKTMGANQQADQAPSVPITADNFSVTSISISPTPMAIINNKAYAEGEVIQARYGIENLKILVLAIHDGDVVLRYQGNNYTVSLKRPLLSPKAPTSDAPTSQESPMILR